MSQTYLDQKKDLRTSGQIMRDQAKTIEEQNKAVSELQQYAQQLIAMLQKNEKHLQEYRTNDYRRHQVTQCVDHAINCMPKNLTALKVDDVMKKAKEFYEAVSNETERLVEIDKAEYELRQQSMIDSVADDIEAGIQKKTQAKADIQSEKVEG